MKKGKVYLVGAGPGDEGLLTIKGLKAIQQADVILFDRLINPNLLTHAPSHCEFIYCGKLPNNHFLKQEMINKLLVQKGQEGYIAVRLKGGDPGVFGRVGEEAELLAKEDIHFEIVPGITSGIAAPLYAGIPVTHRGFGVSFTVVTAHDKSKDGKPIIDWEGLINSSETIAFYMGVSNIKYITENLIRHGKPASTPVILIQWGTYGRQETLQGTLATIEGMVKRTGFKNPAITLVGDVVKLRQKLSWFEKMPLYGRQILLTRTGTKESLLSTFLKEQGADVIEFPKWIKKEIAIDERIIRQLEEYDEILFASTESVDEFVNILVEQNVDIRNIRATLYNISKKSGDLLKNRGLICSPFKNIKQTGKLLVVGDCASNELSITPYLRRKQYDYLQTSEKLLDERFISVIAQMLKEAALDTIIFTDLKTIDYFFEYGPIVGLDCTHLLEQTQILSIGKSTCQSLKQLGYNPHYLSEDLTMEEFVSSLLGEVELENTVSR